MSVCLVIEFLLGIEIIVLLLLVIMELSLIVSLMRLMGTSV